jgi:hypothetical protein
MARPRVIIPVCSALGCGIGTGGAIPKRTAGTMRLGPARAAAYSRS